MNDKIRKAMMRPDCIMGVTADNGGSWLSPIREDGAKPTTLPVAEGQPWAIGSGMLKPQGGMVIDGAFEFPASDAAVTCGTALDLRGNTDPLTFICEFELDEPPEQTQNWYPSLLAQGYPAGGSYTSMTLGLFLMKNNGKKWELRGYLATGTKAVSAASNITIEYGKRYIVALVRDTARNCLTLHIPSMDLMKDSAINTAVSDPLCTEIPSSQKPQLGVCVGSNLNASHLTYQGTYRVYWAAVFNRALSAEEIADLS